ncbi:hypothetical protein GmHk_16G046292 [Glycine max]|nr:hypothetical protein GmHk_16G046292 [Glycine max]
MANTKDDSSIIEETEVNSKFEEVLETFNEIELDKLMHENEKLVSSYKATGCVCASTSLNMDDYKSLQIEFENFKKDHYEERMKLKNELSNLKDLFRKMNKGKSDLSHLLSVKKHTIDKTGLEYNKQTDFSNRTKFASSKKLNPNKVCLKATDSLWYLDSGCSRHMTGDKSRLTDLEGEYVTFGDNNKGRIMEEGNIGNQHKTHIKNVLYVDGLKHNHLSITKTGELVHIGKRIGNIYMLDIEHASFHELSWLVSKIDDSWLWYRRVAYIYVFKELPQKDIMYG